MDAAQSTATYVVTLRPDAHELEVELTLTGLTPGRLELRLPTWVPWQPTFRPYGRDVFNVRASNPSVLSSLPVTREGWSGFVVEGVSDRVTIEYTASAFEPAWGDLAGIVDGHQALLLATRYLQVPGHRGPCTVEYRLPMGWRVAHPDGARSVGHAVFEYPSYEAMLDTPVAAGEHERVTRTSHEHSFHFVFLDKAMGFETESESFMDAVMAVASHCYEIFGSYPFDHYTFFLTFNPNARWDSGHAYSSTLSLDPLTFIDAGARLESVRACAHAFFHAWNGARLKPTALLEPDLAAGTFTDGLWVTEGFTRYYEFLLCTRAGELTVEGFLSNLVNYLRHHEGLPASARVSAADASRAAFLNHGRYPGSVNNAIDYFDAGMLIAFDVDATLRLTGGKTSLDTLFSVFYTLFHDKGFTTQGFKRFFEEHVKSEGELLEREATQTGELSTAKLLEQLGFEVLTRFHRYLGVILEDNKTPIIANVLDTSPAAQAGLAPGDEIVRVNGFAFSLLALQWLVEHEKQVTFEVRRRQRTITRDIQIAERLELSGLSWRGDENQLALLRSWLQAPALDFEAGRTIRLDRYFNPHGIQTVV